MKAWTYVIVATVCVALSVTFLTSPAPSTAQDGGMATLQLAPDQLISPSETHRALFFFQNQGFASYYQQVAAADDSVEIVVVSDVDSFLEQAVTRPGWDVVSAFPDPGDRSDPGLVDHLSAILGSVSSDQGGVQLLVAEQATPARARFDVNSIVPAIKPKESSIDNNLPSLRFEAWMDDSHLSAVFLADGRHNVLEAVGDQQSLMGLGMIMNENRIDFSSPPTNEPQRGGIFGPPFCCGVVFLACDATTFHPECGFAFFLCFIGAGPDGCHWSDGICSAPPGGTQFWLCDSNVCDVFPCGGCISGPANEACRRGNDIGCTDGTCG